MIVRHARTGGLRHVHEFRMVRQALVIAGMDMLVVVTHDYADGFAPCARTHRQAQRRAMQRACGQRGAANASYCTHRRSCYSFSMVTPSMPGTSLA